MLVEIKKILKNNATILIAFGVGFIITLAIFSFYSRHNYVAKILKNEIVNLQGSLNRFGYDLAYEKLEISSLYPSSILSAKNIEIYPLTTGDSFKLKLSELKLETSLWNANHFYIDGSKEITVNINNQEYAVELGENQSDFEIANNGEFEAVDINLYDIKVKDFADIEYLSYKGNKLDGKKVLGNNPSFSNDLNIQDVTLNGLVNYPLAQKINAIKISANLNGRIEKSDDFRFAINEWLKNGGAFNISDFVVNWQPFALLGYGELRFDENIKPQLKLNTSSKALLNLIDELDENKYLDRKGVFVTKVLLNNKAFKISPDDEHFTLSTPIGYRDKRLSIENITVKTFK